MSSLKIKKLDDSAVVPGQLTSGSAGYDITLTNFIEYVENTSKMVFGTSLAMEIPKGCVGLLLERSSTCKKHHVSLANAVGVIDSDYRDEVVAVLEGDFGSMPDVDLKGRLLQLVIVKYENLPIEVVDELGETDRSGGFGSTG